MLKIVKIISFCATILILLPVQATALTYQEVMSSQTSGRVLGAATAGLVGYWNFDEGTGSIAADASGNNNNGTISGANWTAGKVGNALSFNGTNSFVNAGSGASLDDIPQQGGGGMTVAFWINPASNTSNFILSKGPHTNNSGAWEITKSSATNPARLSFFKEGAADFTADWNSVLTTGTWQHIVLAWDGTMALGGISVYKNGSLVTGGGSNGDGAAGNSDAANNLSIGSSDGTSGFLDAGLDEVRIYNRVLTAQEVIDIYNDGRTGDTTPPSTPANLSATAISSSAINLSWTASTDNVGVTGYRIYRGGVQIGTSGTPSYADSNLASNTSYSYTVAAVDGAGNNSAQSLSANATTLPIGPQTYTVKKDGTGNFTTIQACANAMVAGDTCVVYAGTYSENVTVPAGSSAGYKTITANGSDLVYVISFTQNSYTKVNGFHIQNPLVPLSSACVTVTGAARSVYITNNVMTQCGNGNSMIWTDNVSGASYVYIQGNTLSYACGTPTAPHNCVAIYTFGDHYLVENNNISHALFGVDVVSNYTVIRNNAFHDMLQSECADTTCHMDVLYSEPNTALPSAYNLWEGNTARNILGSDSHGYLTGGSVCGNLCHNLIMRYNDFAHLGSGGLIDTTGYTYVKVYNNNFTDFLNAHLAELYEGINAHYQSAPNGAEVNNIFYFPESIGDIGWRAYYVSPDSVPGFSAANNLAWCTGTSCALLGRDNSVTFKADAPGNQVADPKFTNYSGNDFHLAAGSPAIDAGANLTNAASYDYGSGTTLLVNDASYFQDGYGLTGVQPDWIAIGSPTNPSNIVQIVSINYSTNTIILASPITRTPGAPIYLYKDSSGRQTLSGSAPDIGAYEFASSGGSTPVPGDFNLDHIVNSLDYSLLNSHWFQTGSGITTYDLQPDSIINSLDYAIFKNNWGKTW